jgi:hypothetical protein
MPFPEPSPSAGATWRACCRPAKACGRGSRRICWSVPRRRRPPGDMRAGWLGSWGEIGNSVTRSRARRKRRHMGSGRSAAIPRGPAASRLPAYIATSTSTWAVGRRSDGIARAVPLADLALPVRFDGASRRSLG